MNPRKKAPILLKIAAVVCAVAFVVSGFLFLRELKKTRQEAETFAALADLRRPKEAFSPQPPLSPTPIPSDAATETGSPENRQLSTDTPTTPPEETPNEPEEPPVEEQAEGATPEPVPLERYLPLYELNHDFFGWITIPDTRVDYPVMYNAREPLAYLGHDFYHKFSYAGVPFLDSDCDPGGDFYLVYGHRMNDGSMFADLVAYEDQSFWENHRTFFFDTLYEERTYEVAMAIRARVLNQDERTGFRYYNYTSLDSEAEFEEYVTQAKALSLYDTGVELSYGDELLVLSTCYHYTQNGRFVLIARRVTD